MQEDALMLHEDVTYQESDVSLSLKGLLMDKGQGHLDRAIKHAELNVESMEALMLKFVDDYNKLNAPFIKLYLRAEKRVKTGARPRRFLMWTARNDLSKAVNKEIMISSLVDPLEVHKSMRPDVMRVLRSDKLNYKRIAAYDFVRHKINTVYALHYDQYKTLRELRETISCFQRSNIDSQMKKLAREVNQCYVNIPGFEDLFAV